MKISWLLRYGWAEISRTCIEKVLIHYLWAIELFGCTSVVHLHLVRHQIYWVRSIEHSPDRGSRKWVGSGDSGTAQSVNRILV